MQLALEEYQERIVDHVAQNDVAALFVGCGLGKTAACLQAIREQMIDGQLNGVLIVAPLRVANVTWKAETRKWDDFNFFEVANLRTKEGRQALRNHSAHLYVINYEMLPWLCRQKFRTMPFNLVVFDELTKAKNHSSKRINAFRAKFKNRIQYKWGLTGTPMPNSMLELFAQYRLLDGGERLGKAYTRFRDQNFYLPNAYQKYNWEIKPLRDEWIHEQVADITLTMRRSDYLDIPDINIEEVKITLPAEAEKVYAKLMKDLIALIENSGGVQKVEAVTAGVLKNKLLQVCGGCVYDDDKNVVELHTEKLKALKKIAKQESSPLLVGCNYVFEQEAIRKHFKEAVFFQDYKTPEAQDDLVARWNAGKIKMLVSNPQSIGHGLNLQDGGNVLVWFTLPWSGEYYDQFIARLARKGQNEVTKIIKLMVSGKMDDAVAETLRNKDDSQAALLQALIELQK